MSRIFEALKQLSRESAGASRRPRPINRAPERRSGIRRFQRVPVFVYGRSPQGVPFHEETQMTCVNAGGGLTSLSVPVAAGQKLMLVHLGTQAERPCRVVRAQSEGQRAAIAVAFSQATGDFWE